MLPGVPQFFRAKLSTIATHFLRGGAPALVRRVSISRPEIEIVQPLNGAVAAHPDVTFGSYPVGHGDVLTIVTLEAAADAALAIDAALDDFVAALPEGCVAATSSEDSSLRDERP